MEEEGSSPPHTPTFVYSPSNVVLLFHVEILFTKEIDGTYSTWCEINWFIRIATNDRIWAVHEKIWTVGLQTSIVIFFFFFFWLFFGWFIH